MQLAERSKPVRLVIADDQQLMRDAFVVLLSPMPDLEVIASLDSTSDNALVEQVTMLRPDAVLVGTKRLAIPTIEVLARVQQSQPDAGIALVVSSIGGETLTILRDLCMRGASGFGLMLKSSLETVHQLHRLIGAVNERRVVLDPALMDMLVAPAPAGDMGLAALSPREFEVLGWMAKGYHNAAIAASLFLERATVERYIHNIYTKLSDRPPLIQPRAHAIRLYQLAQAENAALHGMEPSAEPQPAPV